MNKPSALATVTETARKYANVKNDASQVQLWQAINSARDAGANNDELESAINAGTKLTAAL